MSYACPQQRPIQLLQPHAASNGGAEVKNSGDACTALLAQLVEHFHGKEGVIGSSPIEGFSENPAQAGFRVSGAVAEALEGRYGNFLEASAEIDPG